MTSRAAGDSENRSSVHRSDQIGDGDRSSRPARTLFAGASPDTVCGSLERLPTGTVFCGRYRVIRCLGTGGFSEVYLTVDLQLDRRVAVKRTRLLAADFEFVMREARMVAVLDHPGIVRIVDVLRDDEYGLLIVMQFVNGVNLSHWMRQRKVSVWRSLEITRRVALSLGHAHAHGIVHRDVKPANILIDAAGNPLLTDFGLAWWLNERQSAQGRSGTIGYMAPEQMRGENDSIDERSDIFSLGIVLYQLLTDRLPFDGPDWQTVESKTNQAGFVPASQWNAEVTAELDRVLDRALHRNPRERFQTMREFARALLAAQNHVDPEPSRRRGESSEDELDDAIAEILVDEVLVPRGLLPYARTDADSYRRLTAGPRDRDGTPLLVRVWRRWCESVDGLETDRLGVLLGPPGSGKTSFVQAGLMAALSSDVAMVCVECRSGDLANQILEGGREQLALIGTETSLAELIKRLRVEETVESQFRKVVLVLDQYESWALEAGSGAQDALAAALRQCDGVHVQVLVVAGAEHWGLVNRLSRAVEVALVEGVNLHSMPLLSKQQARSILEAMGRSYGSLPPPYQPLEPKHARFLEQAIGGLGRDHGGRVLPIQIAMFAHVAELHHWDPEALQRAGGLEELFVEFFEDSFESESASEKNRRLRPVAARMLECLLPAPDQSVRQSGKSLEELENCLAGEFSVPRVRNAAAVLVEELKVAVAVPVSCGDTICPGIRISNDFLVGPLRTWTQRITQSTPAGRAQARFYQLAGMWTRSRERRFLPSTIEFFQIAVATRRMRCNPEQRLFLQAARRRVLVRMGGWVGLVLFVAVLLGSVVKSQMASRLQREALIRAEIEQFYALPAAEVPVKLRKLIAEFPREALIQHTGQSLSRIDAEQRAMLLRAELDPSRWAILLQQLDRLPPEWAEVIHDAVRSHPSLQGLLKRIVYHERVPDAERCRAAIILLHMGDVQPVVELLNIEADAQLAYDVIQDATVWRERQSLIAWIPLLDHPRRSVRYCSAAVLGSFPPDWLEDRWQDIEPRLRRFPDADFTLRQVARWICRSAKGLLDAEHSDATDATRHARRRSSASSPAGDWYVAPSGLDMVRIDVQPMTAGVFAMAPGSIVQLPRQEAKLWIAATPVTRQLYARFLQETSPGQQVRLDPAEADLPQRRMGFREAMRICNWLSELEGLEPVYLASENADAGGRWPVDPDANGYRVPTGGEIIYAITAGIAARDTGMTAGAILKASGRIASLDEDQGRLAVGMSLPNYLGLHLLADWQYPLVEIDQGWSHVMTARDGMFFGQRLSEPYPISVLVVVRDAK